MTAGLFLRSNTIMIEKKPVVFKSPDLSLMKEVVIDHRTKIYIPSDADAEEAKARYLALRKTRRP